MSTTQYSSRLRYVDAGKLNDVVKIDHVPVHGWEHEKLGHLDGFIVDTSTGAVQYAVVKSGGWFNSKRFLLPIGHIDRFDPDKKELTTDVSKDAIKLFPDFDKDKFLSMSDEDLRDFERVTSAACCPDTVIVEEVVWVHDTGGHYREPSWWRLEYGQESPSSARTVRP
jgi:PRC-barrel domain protein